MDVDDVRGGFLDLKKRQEASYLEHQLLLYHGTTGMGHPEANEGEGSRKEVRSIC